MVTQERIKLSDELKKHKEALRALQDDVEKLKNSGSVSTSMVQDIPTTSLDDSASAYFHAVEIFDQVSQPALGDIESATTDATSSAENTLIVAPPIGQAASSLSQTPAAVVPSTRTNEEKDRRVALYKANLKLGRKLVRPNIIKPKEPQGDVEMPEADESVTVENQGNATAPTTAIVRKRPSTSSSSDLQEEMLAPEDTSPDVSAPLLKKSKPSEIVHDGGEEQSAAPAKLAEVVAVEESSDLSKSQQTNDKEDALDAEKVDFEIAGEQLEESTVDEQSQQVEQLSDTVDVADEKLEKPGDTVPSDDQLRDQTEQDIQQIVSESGGEREEGELVTDLADNDVDSNISNEIQGEQSIDREKSPSSEPFSACLEVGEIDPSQTPEEEKIGDMTENIFDSPDKLNDVADPIAESDRAPSHATADEVSASTSVDAGSSEQGGSTPTQDTGGKPVSPLNSGSRTIILSERARQRATLRQAGMVASSSPGRARGRAIRGRGARGGRTPRGQSPG